VEITVLAGGDILKQLPEPARQAAQTSLERRGIRFHAGARVIRVEGSSAMLTDGARVDFDLFMNAVGLSPRPLARGSGLPVDDRGALILDRHLRSPADPMVHGGGDGVAVEGHELPRVGVYAIRQGPVLFHNLLAAAEGTAPRPFIPQDRYLWIMNLGDRTGLAARGDRWWMGRSAWWLKDWIDRRFLAEYRTAG